MDTLTLIYNWFQLLTRSDWILLLTFIAIVIYTIETYKLRKWQQKSVQTSILDLRQRILMHQDQMRSINRSSDLNLNNADIANIMNDILTKGKFNLNSLYSKGIINNNFKINYYLKFKNWFKKEL